MSEAAWAIAGKIGFAWCLASLFVAAVIAFMRRRR